MSDLLRPTRKMLALSAVGLSLAFLAGCTGGQAAATGGSDDSRKVSDVVEEFNEARLSTRQSVKLFVKGALPAKAEFKKYGDFSYWPNAGPPSISGDSARMTIAVRNEKTGVDSGQVEWTFKKEGDGWKIAAAPLP